MGIAQQITIPGETDAPAVFSGDQRSHFSAHYPETPHLLRHRLGESALLTLDGLAALAGRLPDSSIEYTRGNLPIGVDGKPAPSGLTIEETIRHIATSDSWAVLKNIESTRVMSQDSASTARSLITWFCVAICSRPPASTTSPGSPGSTHALPMPLRRVSRARTLS